LRGRRAGRGCSGAGISQEKSGCRGRDGAQVGRRGLERDVAARRADRRRGACAIGLCSAGRHGNALRGRRTPGRRARAGVSDKHIRDAIRIAIHQIHCGRKKRDVASVRADRGGNAVAIGGVAVPSDGCDCHRGFAACRRARAHVTHEDVLRRSGNLRHTVGRGQHDHRVALVRAHARCG
jgi:hypothetical protein